MIIRTTEEIKNKLKEGFSTDFFGFGVQDIAEALSFEDIKEMLTDEFLNNPNAKEIWEEGRLETKQDVVNRMKNYLDFAWEKANDERGLSADRSIQHYIAWSWLIDDELYNKLVHMYETEYGYYGKNILSYIEEWINNQ